MDLLYDYLLLSCFYSLTNANFSHRPRMTFTDTGTKMERLPLPGQHVPMRIVEGGQEDAVLVAGQKHLILFNFKNPQKTPVEQVIKWEECIGKSHPQKGDKYTITVVHRRGDLLFLCATSARETLCSEMNMSEQSPVCINSDNITNIKGSIRNFIIKEGEPSALEESQTSADLYVTLSGSEEYVGIHRFGAHKVGSSNQDKEKHYVGLVLSKREEDPLQSRVYAFYKEKNRDTGLHSDMWHSYVSQVCMADVGGPKNILQYTWTSLLNARLFCGDHDRRQHFSELIDVTTVPADRWKDTMVYALFRNEWGMTAVCVYKIRDINNVFTSSTFKNKQDDRPRECVSDSTKIPVEILRKIVRTTEMSDWVMPNSGLLLFNHHNYTHIYVDGSQHKSSGHHPVLFLTLNNGRIHKVTVNKTHNFVIAEYQPFDNTAHALSIHLDPSSKKLYVNSRKELVQLDVANCGQYGDKCEDCVLARDPYCGWNGARCVPETENTKQDVAKGNYTICKSGSDVYQPPQASKYSFGSHDDEKMSPSPRLPYHSKYFLMCPVTSHHAKYTWEHPEGRTVCDPKENQCVLLIDRMGPEKVGTYTCVSEESGYSKVLAQHQLQLGSRASGHSSGPLVWACLMAVLTMSLCGWF